MSAKIKNEFDLEDVQQSHEPSEPSKEPHSIGNEQFLLECRVKRAQELNAKFKKFCSDFQNEHSNLKSIKTSNDKLVQQIDEISKQCFHKEEVRLALQTKLEAVLTNFSNDFIEIAK